MIRVTRRPMRPKPLTPMPVDMVVEAEVDADALREVPAKEYPEAVPAEARAKATANFMVLVRYVITLSKSKMIHKGPNVSKEDTRIEKWA